MDEFEKSKRQLLDLLTANIALETIDYVRQEMRQNLGADALSAPELRAFFQSPDMEFDAFLQKFKSITKTDLNRLTADGVPRQDEEAQQAQPEQAERVEEAP